ncbi:MAG: hypothetical protein AB7O67_16645 [Vicinamibacterales bacterium]
MEGHRPWCKAPEALCSCEATLPAAPALPGDGEHPAWSNETIIAALLSHLYRLYDAGGLSCGRSWESRMVEPMLALTYAHRPPGDVATWPDRDATIRLAEQRVRESRTRHGYITDERPGDGERQDWRGYARHKDTCERVGKYAGGVFLCEAGRCTCGLDELLAGERPRPGDGERPEPLYDLGHEAQRIIDCGGGDSTMTLVCALREAYEAGRRGAELREWPR